MSGGQGTKDMELTVLILMGLYSLLSFIPGVYYHTWFQFLLAPALLFPGISHGAVDHHLDLKDKRKGIGLFLLQYISIMLVVLGIWLLVPIAGLLLFVLLSAWHFGETDLREWGMYHPVRATLFGWGIIGLLLFGHAQETSSVVSMLKTETLCGFVIACKTIGLCLSAVCLLIPLHAIKGKHLSSYLAVVFILLLGLLLPLLSAFLWYFCAWHSIRGWLHLRVLTNASNWSLVKMSLPFTIGALLVFAGLYFFYHYFLSQDGKQYAIFFIFIASLSAPHILSMHHAYRGHLAGAR